MNWKNALKYFVWTTIEELAFRVALIYILGHNWLGIILSTIIYALAHRIGFKWEMVVACLPLGLVLGYLYVILPLPYDVIWIVIIHFIVGALAYELKLTERWTK